MARTPKSTLNLATDTRDDVADSVRAGLFVWGLGLAILVGGFIWLGRAGMLDPKSPDFFPLPDFFAIAALLVGAVFLTVGGLHAIRRSRYGTSTLEAEGAELGQTLAGTVRTERPVVATGPIRVTLRCSSTTSATSSRDSTTGLLWEAVQEVVEPVNSAGGIPFSFPIPGNGLRSGRRARPKTGVHPEEPDWVTWELSVTAPTGGMPYSVTFPITIGGPTAARAVRARAMPSAPAETRGQKLGLSILSAATVLVGGRVPDATERAAIRSGAEDAGAGAEPAVPFAGTAVPVQPWERPARWVLFGFGLMFGLGGAWGELQQIRFTGRAEISEATVTAATRKSVSVRLASGVAGEVAQLSGFHSFAVGQAVTVACSRIEAEPRRCQMQTGLDRFLGGIWTTLLGALLLAIAWYLRYRRTALR